MYKTLLVAVDGSEYAMRATEEAIKIAQCCTDATIDLVYVADSTQTRKDVLQASSLDVVELERQQRLAPYEQVVQQANLPYKLTILTGNPGPTIIDYAQKQAVDLIIIGSRGLNALQEMMLGSVSHKVVQRVSCPTLIVK